MSKESNCCRRKTRECAMRWIAGRRGEHTTLMFLAAMCTSPPCYKIVVCVEPSACLVKQISSAPWNNIGRNWQGVILSSPIPTISIANRWRRPGLDNLTVGRLSPYCYFRNIKTAGLYTQHCCFFCRRDAYVRNLVPRNWLNGIPVGNGTALVTMDVSTIFSASSFALWVLFRY